MEDRLLSGMRRAVLEDLAVEAEHLAPVTSSQFGTLVLEAGFVTREQLDECLAEQKRAVDSGGRPPILSQILLRRRLLSARQIVQLLSKETGDGPDSQRIGRYLIVGTLGQGAAGTVYRAMHPDLKKEIALKVMVEHAELPRQLLERFHREARIAAALQHPNIIAVHDVGSDGPRHYLAMDLVEGPTLARWMREPNRRIREKIAVLETAASALHHAHRHGVIHRDFKPANVLIGADGQPRITDFGLALSLGGPSGMTHQGTVLGTPAYMAPEQVRGELLKIDARTDVYALGSVLYEMLTGRPPHTGLHAHAVYEKILKADPDPPRTIVDVDRDLEAVCLKALEKEPDRRYSGADSFAKDLSRWLAGEPVVARRITPAGRTLRWVRRNPLLSTATFVTLAALAGGALFGVWQLNRARVAAQTAAEKAERELDAERRRAETEHWSRLLLQSAARINAARMEQYHPIPDPDAWREGIRAEIRRLDEALSHLPDSPEGRLVKGIALGLLHEEDAAEREFSEAIRLARPSILPEAHLERARINILRCFNMRFPVLGRAEEERKRRFAALQKVLLEDFERAKEGQILGLEDARRMDVMRHFNRFLEASQQVYANPPPSSLEEVRRLHETALAACEEAARGGGHVEEYRVLIAILLDFLGYARETAKKDSDALVHYQKARSQLDRAIEINPNYTEAFCRRGHLNLRIYSTHLRLGEKREAEASLLSALEDFRHALRHHPRHAEAHHLLAYAYSRSLQDEKAIDLYDKILSDLAPDSSKTYLERGRAWFRLSRSSSGREELENGTRDLRKAAEMTPEYSLTSDREIQAAWSARGLTPPPR